SRSKNFSRSTVSGKYVGSLLVSSDGERRILYPFSLSSSKTACDSFTNCMVFGSFNHKYTIMCYHSSHPNEKQIRKQYKSLAVEYSQDEIFHISGFTRPYLPVLLNDQTNTVREARWKLIPFWVKDEEGAAKYANTLNAEGESIFTKASYRPYIGKNRGLL